MHGEQKPRQALVRNFSARRLLREVNFSIETGHHANKEE